MRPTLENKPNNRFGFRRILAVVLVCGCLGVMVWFFSPQTDDSFHPVTMDDLKGVWTTPYPTYQDRFLQFNDGSITFGWGADKMGSYTIHEIDSEPAEGGARVHIRYNDRSGTTYQFNFYYTNQHGGLLRMKNQKGVEWSHANDLPVHPLQFQ